MMLNSSYSEENHVIPGEKSTSTRNYQKHSRQINTIMLLYVRIYRVYIIRKFLRKYSEY